MHTQSFKTGVGMNNTVSMVGNNLGDTPNTSFGGNNSINVGGGGGGNMHGLNAQQNMVFRAIQVRML